MTQSRIMSLVEATTNVLVGYVFAIATQLVVFPLFGLEAALSEHLAIGLIFLVVSLARSYLLRRLFERIKTRAPRSQFSKLQRASIVADIPGQPGRMSPTGNSHLTRFCQSGFAMCSGKWAASAKTL
jgi:membrane protein implicated in regulation of membrane protease activity